MDDPAMHWSTNIHMTPESQPRIKRDFGPGFDVARLVFNGLGSFPEVTLFPASEVHKAWIQEMARASETFWAGVKAGEAIAKSISDPRDPDYSRDGIFQTHNCGRCDNGKKPCASGHPHNCDLPHARND